MSETPSKSRRDFLKSAAKVAGAATLAQCLPQTLFAKPKTQPKPFERIPFKTLKAQAAKFEDGRRIIGGLDGFVVTKNPADCEMFFDANSAAAANLKDFYGAEISITTGAELLKNISIDARIRGQSVPFASFRLNNGFSFQPQRISVDLQTVGKILEHGLSLNISEGELDRAYFLKSAPTPRLNNLNSAQTKTEYALSPENASGLLPHILLKRKTAATTAKDVFYTNLTSLNSINPFGWMEGCQFEGLHCAAENGDAIAAKALELHTDFFFAQNGELEFDDWQSRKLSGGKFNSVEDLLPFAYLAKILPEHLCVRQAKRWALNHIAKDRSGFLSTEGCYTLAYPLMEIARAQKDAAAAQKAVDEILKRDAYLRIKSGAICQRGKKPAAPKFINWARGTAWHMLGIAKTLQSMQRGGFDSLSGTQNLKEALNSCAEYVVNWQSKNGCWNCFTDSPQTGSEASGTAGIAAALAVAAKEGFINKSYAQNARRALGWLFGAVRKDGKFLNFSADGFARNVTQSNRLGEDFQRSGWRVIMQLSSGLAQQAISAL